ncbi:hypothetical protein CRV04_02195 [Candidatus Marinarcus aquaticus]|uniref:Transposase n=2 Tax=Candidatus Marinarcus aquaticus TaxID=2044504 RepID=A0A4Q0XTE4_9BACT|nr:hypothetical protein CRV04_02195 [Candidatus Marinarcus aquaticus]
MNCPKCNMTHLYSLSNDYFKCASCKTKFSLKKQNMDCEVIHLFCSNINAQQSAQLLKVNYRTVANRYALFRKLIAKHAQEVYEQQIHTENSYEEHYYFTQRQKNRKRKSLYEAVNIIGFYSNQTIFTLLMPKLSKSALQEHDDSFERYLSWHKLQSQNAYKTPLKVFWAYLEQNLKKYKGISEENFFYYLKECEFKYNYVLHQQIEILKNLYFKL